MSLQRTDRPLHCLPLFALDSPFGGLLIVPFWLLSCAFFLPTFWLRRRRMRRRPPGACPACGYDLTGNVSGRCPECGAKAA